VFSVLAQQSDGTSTLDTAKVFTSLSLFTLLSEPLGSLIMALSSLMGGIGSFHRIQEFISAPAMPEPRKLPPLRESGHFLSMADMRWDSEKGSDSSNQDLTASGISDASFNSSQAVIFDNATIGWVKDGSSKVLSDIDLAIPRGKITMIVGPVGCGKSTLLKAILGEVPYISGTLQVSSLRIALCDQTPWHINSTVQQSIVGVSAFDQRWYSSVVHSCALDDDLRQLPLGDQTQIGSKGISLSGGQSQRIVSRPILSNPILSLTNHCTPLGTCKSDLRSQRHCYT
jgi:ATP-binding cassette subfamily C (CFTR/MRP) protein 1